MTRKTRRNVLAALTATTTVGLAGCNSSGEDDGGDTTTAMTTTTEGTDGGRPSGTAGVRVAHFSPDAPNVDVYVDGSQVLSDVAFGTVSSYLQLPTGTYPVEITAAGDPDTVAFEGDIQFEERDYTVAAVGELSGDDTEFRPLVLEDDNSEPAEDTARVRLVHASPDAPAVDVTLASNGDAVYDGIAFRESGYVEVPAGTYTLQVRGDTAGNDGDVVGQFTVELAGGTVYTGFAGGYLTPGDDPGDPAFDLTLAVDAGAGGGGRIEPSFLRVAHFSPDAPDVDVYVDDARVLSGVPFRAVSDYLRLTPGTHTVEITAAGDRGTVAFEGDVTLDPGPYTVAAVGELSSEDAEFRPLVLDDDNSDPGEDTARVRLVHASPDAPAVDVTLASNGDVVYDGVAFGESGYVEVPAGTYTLQVRGDTAANDGDVVAEYTVELAGGTVYTGFAGGYLTPGDDPADEQFDLTFAVDAGAGGGGRIEPSFLRVAHFSPDAPDVDVYVDDARVLSGVPFRAVSDYLQLAPGEHAVEITAAGDPDTVAFEGTVSLDPGPYTVAAVGELSGDDAEFRPLVLEDDNSDPGEDTARVRLVHASPDAPAVDVTLATKGDVVYDGVAFGESGYVEVPAGTYTLQVRGDTAGNDGDVVAKYTVQLAGGTVYTGFAGGYLTPGDDPADEPFDLTFAVDAGADTGTSGSAFLRVAHLSPDAPNVDVYLDDSRVLSDVPFRTISDYLELSPGQYLLEITPAGNPDNVVFQSMLRLEPGPYTVIATGELSDDDTRLFPPKLVRDDNSDPGEDTARVRLVHASPDAPAVDVTLASNGEAVFDGVAFDEISTAEVPAGTYTLQVRGDTEGNDGDVVAEFEVTLDGGSVYSAFAVGYLTPGDEPVEEPFGLKLVRDAQN